MSSLDPSPWPWPFTLDYGPLTLRTLRRKDEAAWLALRISNERWLAPWEATSPGTAQPGVGAKGGLSFRDYVRRLDAEGRSGAGLPLVIEYRGLVAGQVWVAQIGYGALWGASVGYWVGEQFAGLRLAPAAVALVTDYLFFEVGLHRMEVNIRPENERSLSLVRRLGFRYEGLRQSYIHIAGDWRDHESYAITREEVPQGLLRRWLAKEPLNWE